MTDSDNTSTEQIADTAESTIPDPDLARVYGDARAAENEQYGVYGETDAGDGYGLYTPDDVGVGGTVEASASAVSDRDNEINVRNVGGETLADRIDAALEMLDRSGRIRIPRPRPGSPATVSAHLGDRTRGDGPIWYWGSGRNPSDEYELLIPANQYEGVTLDFDRGVLVEYDGSKTALKVVGSNADANQYATVAIDGVDAEVTCTRENGSVAGDPSGFVVADDVSHFTCKINTRDFLNSAGTATAVTVRNVENFTEGWKLEGDHRACNRGVDFEVANGDGTTSFVDGRAQNLSVSGTDFGLRLRGNHKANVFDNVHFFFGAPDARGLVLDGLVAETTFVGPRWDDTNDDYSSEVAIETGSNFKTFDGKPVFVNPQFANVNTVAVKDNYTHDLWALRTRGGGVGFEDLESNERFHVGRGASFRAGTVGEEPDFAIGGNGNVQAGGNWQTGTPPKFLDGNKLPQLSSDPSPPAGTAIRYVSDGSAGVTGDDGDYCVAVTDSAGNTKTGVLFDFDAN